MIIGVNDIKVEKIPFPKEEVEFIVDQILKVSGANGYDKLYTHELTTTIDILNDTLKKMVQPQLIISDKELRKGGI